MAEFEEQVRLLELKTDKMLTNVIEKRHQHIVGNKDLYEDYWLRVFSNHKLFKDFINEEDKPLLKKLRKVTSQKLEDGNVSYKVMINNDSLLNYFLNLMRMNTS
jgi:hypothetical protein